MKGGAWFASVFAPLQLVVLASHLLLCHSMCIEPEKSWAKYTVRNDGRNQRATCALRISPGSCSTKSKKRGKVFFLDHYPTTYVRFPSDPYGYVLYEPQDNDDPDYHYDYTLSAYEPEFSHGYYYESYHDELFSTGYARCTKIINPRLSCDGPYSTLLEYDSIETELRTERPKKSLRVDRKRLFFQSRFISKSAMSSAVFKGSNAIPDCDETAG